MLSDLNSPAPACGRAIFRLNLELKSNITVHNYKNERPFVVRLLFLPNMVGLKVDSNEKLDGSRRGPSLSFSLGLWRSRVI